jgi:translation initiation factor 3 subunit L
MFVELPTFNIYPMFLCRVALLTYKHKTHVINNDGSVLSNADVDFYVDDDMVHIADTKTTKRFGDYFIRHISKFDEIINDLDRVQLE